MLSLNYAFILLQYSIIFTTFYLVHKSNHVDKIWQQVVYIIET